MKTDALLSRSGWRRTSRSVSAISGNPLDLKLLGWIEVADAFQLERQLHQHFESTHVRGEWFAIEPAEILPILMRAGLDGFVAKNADAFQVIGYELAMTVTLCRSILGYGNGATLRSMNAAPTAAACAACTFKMHHRCTTV
ncbi:GIY-YIG nuclease family protein [Pseudomonas cedrina]|uniref:GIY-YIG nuclease family protein n=1 Tax=Pseudomonas cedrina TaxID=651740 RepID=UPI001E284EB9|nr:GIY-YIG nuclease family protein [Pseudomonas cedrina]